MMKKSLISAALVTTWAVVSQAGVFTSYRALPATHITMPAMPTDSGARNQFKTEQLLKARAASDFRRYQAQDWTTVTPDADGVVHLVSDAGPTLNTLATRIRASRYAKGNLRLTSPARVSLRVDGAEMETINNADSAGSTVTKQITLLPEQTHDIEIVILSMPDDKAGPTVKLEFVPDKEFEDVPISEGFDTRRRFMPVTTMIGPRVTFVSLSPDGKYLLTSYRQVFSATESESYSTLSETATGKILNAHLSAGVRWLPDHNTLYYTESNKNGHTLYYMDVPTMQTRVVAKGLPESPEYILPGGKTLLWYDKVSAPVSEGPLHRFATPDSRIPGNEDRYYLVAYDLDSRIVRPLTYGGWTTSLCDYTRDGKKILYLSQTQEPSRYPFYFGSLVQLDLTTMQSDTIISDNGYISNAIYSPDARSLFITGGPQTFGESGVNAGSHEIPNAFDTQGYIYDIATRNVRAVTRDFDPAIEGTPIWNANDNKIYLRGESGFNTNLYVLNPSDGKITSLANEIRSVSGISLGENESTWMAYWGGDFTDTGVAWLLNLKTGKQRLIDDPMQEELSDIDFGTMQQWQFTARDGSTIDGYICLPPDFDETRKYPLIVYYYGGTSPSTAAMHHLYSPQVFASRDYVVYVINPSGTTGYGQEFSSRHVNAWGDYTADDIIEGVEKFVKAHPFVDDKKIGCLGASYGGFMTQYLQTKTDLFAAAVSHAGISNVASYWGEGFWGYSYNSVAAAKRYPWTDPDLYTQHGSLFNADKIHTPLLLLHGNLDTNVPIGESIQLFNALSVLGRTVEFISVDDENHVISNFDRKLLWQNTIMAWFAKYLQDDPRWWNSLYN